MEALKRAEALCTALARRMETGEAGDDLEQWLGELAPDRRREIAETFYRSLPELKTLLELDVRAALAGDPAAVSDREVRWAYPGLRAVAVYRMAHLLWQLRTPLIPRLMTEYAHSVTGIDIHPGAEIGKYFFIDHGTGVVIGETARIGDHVKLYQGVTLGGLSTRDANALRGKKRHPTLGNRVTVYANATILGGDTVIGDDCTIGANVFLTGSVPPGTTVVRKEPELKYVAR